ncbi:MAG: glycosyltransferase family 39 protein [Spirochaetota bacterium]
MSRTDPVKYFYNIFQLPTVFTFFFIAIVTVILRLPSVVIDFIHVDVLTSYLLAKRELLGLSFGMNKGWLYHWLMKFSITYIADTPSSFHFIGLLFVLGTMYGIFLLAKKIYDERIGLFAAFLYGVVISCYHTEYLAANGEIFYNLFNIYALYFYYRTLYEKKKWYGVLVLVNIIGSYLIKFQGIFILPIILVHFIVVYPLSFEKQKYLQFYKYLIGIIISAIVIGIGLAASLKVYYAIDVFEKIHTSLSGMYSYVANRGFNPLLILMKLLWRVYQFSLFHAFFWYSGVILIISFFKNLRAKTFDSGAAFLVYVALCFFILIFAAGSRVSVHYFIPIMPVLAALSAKQILDVCTEKGKKLVYIQLMITLMFFLVWNYKDLYIYKCNHNLKHNESKLTEIFRIAVIGSYGEYLLPHKSLLPVIDYINNNYPDRTMLVWPMGTEIDYFTKGHSVVPSYWFNEKALFAIVQREKGNDAFIHEHEDNIINIIREYKPELFVDVGSTDMIKKVMVYRKKGEPAFYFNIHETPILRLGRFASLDDFPKILKYLNEKYEFKGYFGKVRLWVRK